MTPYKEFGEFISDFFGQYMLGMTQTEIARELGTQQSVVSKWYSGERLPTEDMVRRIKDLLGKDISDRVKSAKQSRRINLSVEEVPKKLSVDVASSIRDEYRPRVEVYANAGTLTEQIDASFEQMPVIAQMPKYDFTIIVKGDSMEPEFRSGEEIACLNVKNTSYRQWGRPHVLNTSQGVVLKRIYQGERGYICRSDNPKYPDFEVPEEDVWQIALVVGMLRTY
jgi:phage repressor protein C with HTH and peptisase S24 domain